MPKATEIMRAYRLTLDPTSAQEAALSSHAGASRWAYNFALGFKKAAQDIRDGRIDAELPERLQWVNREGFSKADWAERREHVARVGKIVKEKIPASGVI